MSNAIQSAAADAAKWAEQSAIRAAAQLAARRTTSAASKCAAFSAALERAAIAAIPKAPRPKYGRLILKNEGETVTYRGKHKGRTHQMSKWALQYQPVITRHGVWLWDDAKLTARTGLSAAASLAKSAEACGYTLSEKPQPGKRPALWLATKGDGAALIGYVARGGGTDYHADTEAEAIAGLAEKIAKLAALKDAKKSAAQQPVTAEKIAAKFGFCRLGIAATAAELGLDAGGSYTPAEILAAAKGKDLSHRADFARFARHFGGAA